MKRVLITGGTGFVGRHTVPQLLSHGYEVHLVSRSSPALSPPRSLHYHSADLFDPRQQAILFAEVRPTHLLHFAWHTTPGEYWTSAKNLDWVRSSLLMLHNFVEAGGRRMVVAGTCAEYDWSGGRCSELLTPSLPLTLYGSCKNALRQTCEASCEQSGVECAWGRIFFLYGPHEHPA